MYTVYLLRQSTSDQGTFGTLSVSTGEATFKCFTGELPWRNNKVQVSCIPPGTYRCSYWSSRKFPRSYHVQDVPRRTAILIHSGNFCGDTRKNLRSNVLGCILLGKNIGYIKGQKAVLNSRLALDKFIEVMGKESFTLAIEEQYDS